jgi:hypothetical protein
MADDFCVACTEPFSIGPVASSSGDGDGPKLASISR